MSSFEALYQAKLTTPTKAVEAIKDHMNLIMGSGAGQPLALMKAVGERARNGAFARLNVYYLHGHDEHLNTIFTEDTIPFVKPHPLFMSRSDRELARRGHEKGEEWVHFVPCMFHQAGRLLTEHVRPDVHIVTVSPMDKSGHFSLGTNPDVSVSVIRKARHVIVEVNPQMPRTFGECLVHINDVDQVVEYDHPLMEYEVESGSQVDETIGKLIAEQIQDGATIQMGIGAVPDAAMRFLGDKNDLGLHSELFSPAMASLIKQGIINGRKKTFLPHKHVYTLALGNREMFDFMDDNPSIVGFPASFTNSPKNIRQNKGMISVNAAIEMDLSGQINSEMVGGLQFSGTGGQLDFLRGAYASEGGKSFLALHSTAKDDKVSRIVPKLENCAVTGPRMEVMNVVTEYGVAELKGKCMQRRAAALIEIAHPKFREDLRAAARKSNLL